MPVCHVARGISANTQAPCAALCFWETAWLQQLLWCSEWVLDAPPKNDLGILERLVSLSIVDTKHGHVGYCCIDLVLFCVCGCNKCVLVEAEVAMFTSLAARTHMGFLSERMMMHQRQNLDCRKQEVNGIGAERQNTVWPCIQRRSMHLAGW